MYLSGGEPENLLQHLINKIDTRLNLRGDMKQMVISVQKLHAFSEKKNKTKVLSIVAPHFPSAVLKNIGFEFSSKSFTRARKEQVWEKKRFIPPSKTPISRNQKRKLHDFLMDHSTIASNRTKKILLSEYFGNLDGQ